MHLVGYNTFFSVFTNSLITFSAKRKLLNPSKLKIIIKSLINHNDEFFNEKS